MLECLCCKKPVAWKENNGQLDAANDAANDDEADDVGTNGLMPASGVRG